MTKYLITLAVKSRFVVPKVGQFLFNNEYGKYLYEGRALSAEEFNKVAPQIFGKPPVNLGYAIIPEIVECDAAEARPKKRTAQAPTPPTDTP